MTQGAQAPFLETLHELTSDQAFAYFTTFGSSDRKVYIYLIAVLLLIDVVHTIITVCVSFLSPSFLCRD